MAIITPSRHMETLTLAIVRNVRRRLRQQFFRTRGINRNMWFSLVYEFPRPFVSAFQPGLGPVNITKVCRTDSTCRFIALAHAKRYARSSVQCDASAIAETPSRV